VFVWSTYQQHFSCIPFTLCHTPIVAITIDAVRKGTNSACHYSVLQPVLGWYLLCPKASKLIQLSAQQTFQLPSLSRKSWIASGYLLEFQFIYVAGGEEYGIESDYPSWSRKSAPSSSNSARFRSRDNTVFIFTTMGLVLLTTMFTIKDKFSPYTHVV
jgi:hypothetical protein